MRKILGIALALVLWVQDNMVWGMDKGCAKELTGFSTCIQDWIIENPPKPPTPPPPPILWDNIEEKVSECFTENGCVDPAALEFLENFNEGDLVKSLMNLMTGASSSGGSSENLLQALDALNMFSGFEEAIRGKGGKKSGGGSVEDESNEKSGSSENLLEALEALNMFGSMEKLLNGKSGGKSGSAENPLEGLEAFNMFGSMEKLLKEKSGKSGSAENPLEGLEAFNMFNSMEKLLNEKSLGKSGSAENPLESLNALNMFGPLEKMFREKLGGSKSKSGSAENPLEGLAALNMFGSIEKFLKGKFGSGGKSGSAENPLQALQALNMFGSMENLFRMGKGSGSNRSGPMPGNFMRVKHKCMKKMIEKKLKPKLESCVGERIPGWEIPIPKSSIGPFDPFGEGPRPHGPPHGGPRPGGPMNGPPRPFGSGGRSYEKGFRSGSGSMEMNYGLDRYSGEGGYSGSMSHENYRYSGSDESMEWDEEEEEGYGSSEGQGDSDEDLMNTFADMFGVDLSGSGEGKKRKKRDLMDILAGTASASMSDAFLAAVTGKPPRGPPRVFRGHGGPEAELLMESRRIAAALYNTDICPKKSRSSVRSCLTKISKGVNRQMCDSNDPFIDMMDKAEMTTDFCENRDSCYAKMSPKCEADFLDQKWFMCRCFEQNFANMNEADWLDAEEELSSCVDEEMDLDDVTDFLERKYGPLQKRREMLYMKLKGKFCNGPIRNPCERNGLGELKSLVGPGPMMGMFKPGGHRRGGRGPPPLPPPPPPSTRLQPLPKNLFDPEVEPEPEGEEESDTFFEGATDSPTWEYYETDEPLAEPEKLEKISEEVASLKQQ